MDGNDHRRVSLRKLDHLELALGGHAEGPTAAWWDNVLLVHDCLPEIDFQEVDLRTDFLGQQLQAPLWITGMTGGHERASVINARLGAAAERHGLAMGLGSQRAGLSVDSLMATYEAARRAAPRAVLLANIGVPQLLSQGDSSALSVNDLRRIVDSIDAQGLAIHLNYLQEMVQREGDRNARGGLDAIAGVVRSVPVPVMVKETGAGMSRKRVFSLREAGVAAVDVGGAGGTSMVRIESERLARHGDEREKLAHAFDRWGIPTAAAVLETARCGMPVVATGGIRSGVDAARALALGASAVGVGLPFLLAANESEQALDSVIVRFIQELRTALFLTGSSSPTALSSQGAVLLGDLHSWATQRGLLA